MSLKDIWHNGAKRLLIVLIVISGLIFLVVGGVAVGVFVLADRTQKMNTRTEAIEAKQSEISGKVKDNTDAVKDFQNAFNEGWQTFQNHNPTQPVPQIAEPPDEGKHEVVIKPALAQPSQPKPKIQTKTVIKYKARPTPTPYRFPNWLKKRP